MENFWSIKEFSFVMIIFSAGSRFKQGQTPIIYFMFFFGFIFLF